MTTTANGKRVGRPPKAKQDSAPEGTDPYIAYTTSDDTNSVVHFRLAAPPYATVELTEIQYLAWRALFPGLEAKKV